MPFGALQRSKSYRQLWRRSATRTPPLGRGAASLILGSDEFDEEATLQVGDRIEVSTTGLVNDGKRLEIRGEVRLNAAPPVGYGWRVSVTVGAFTQDIDFVEATFGALNFPVTFDLDDVSINTAGLLGVTTFAFALELIQDPAAPGPIATDVDVVLPSVYIDQVIAPEAVPADLYISDRFPAPAQTDVPNNLPALTFRLSDVSGAGVDLANTAVTVDGVTVYTGSAFVAPWTGSTTVGTGPTGNDVDFSLTPPASFTPLGSEEEVEVNVQSQLVGPASPLNSTWSFFAADTTPPAV